MREDVATRVDQAARAWHEYKAIIKVVKGCAEQNPADASEVLRDHAIDRCEKHALELYERFGVRTSLGGDATIVHPERLFRTVAECRAFMDEVFGFVLWGRAWLAIDSAQGTAIVEGRDPSFSSPPRRRHHTALYGSGAASPCQYTAVW